MKNIQKIKNKVLFILLLGMFTVYGQAIPKFSIGVENASSPEDVSVSLQVMFLITILSIAPSLLVMLTSFVRFIIVFSFLKRALGTQTMPPDQILVGLSLFLTLFVMTPVFNEINDTALQPYLAEEILWKEGVDRAALPIKRFMLRQVQEQDVALFIKVGNKEVPNTPEELTFDVLIPAFITSELKIAFIISFVIFIPFLVIDMIVSSILLSMGMMMLPPIMISLPFKIILFVLIDGWGLLVRQLVASFY